MTGPQGSATQRTALFSRQQPGGFWNTASIDKQPGNIWFWDSTHASATDSASYGRNPDRPFATLDYAVSQCTASNGDIVYGMPNSSETIDAASALDLDVIGVSVIGLGKGDARPVLNWTDADGTVEIAAADVTISNFRFTQGVDAVVTMFDVNADDFTMEYCEFVEAAAAQAVSFVDVDGGGANAADNFTMYRCRVIQRAAGADQVVDIAVVQDGTKIIECVMDVDCVNAPLYSPAIHTDCEILRNIIKNRQAGDHAIEFSAAALGFIVDNRLFASTLGTILDPGSCYCAGNLEADAIDQSGVASPLASAGPAPAGWIDAAAIATDAIDADAIADNAIDAGAIAANAITAAEIADAAIDVATFATDISTWQLDTATSTSALTSGTLFTWTGSIEFYLIGRVTTIIQNQATNTKITVTPDALAAYDICANLDIDTFAAGTLLSITGTAANAMVGTTAVGSLAPGQANPVYVTCVTNGVISTVFGAASTGAIVWELLWRPLQAGSTVT